MRWVWMLVPLALSGCLTCTLMYVPGGLSVSLEGGDWPAGAYEVRLVGERDVALCTLNLPYVDEADYACTEGATALLGNDQASVVSMSATQFVDELVVDVEILRDDELVFAEEIYPAYATYEPNGRGCGEVTQASVEIDL